MARQVRLACDRGYDLKVKGRSYRARRIRVRVHLTLTGETSLPAVLDTGAFFSFLPQNVWEDLLPGEDLVIAVPEELKILSGRSSAPQSCATGSPAFEAAVHRATGIGLSPSEAIECDFALVRACLFDQEGGNSGWLHLPALLAHTDRLEPGRRPQDVILGFAGILDRARLLFDFPSGRMFLSFP